MNFSGVAKRLSSPSRRLSIAGVALVLVTLTAAGLTTWHGYQETTASHRREIANLGLVLAEQTARAIQAVDLVLQELQAKVVAEGIRTPAQFAEQMGTPEVHRLLVGRMANLPQADAIVLTDSSGRPVNSSRFWPIPSGDFSDRDYFRHMRDHDDHGLFVGSPALGRFSGTWVVFLARRVNGPSGEFLGVVGSGIELSYFEEVYRAINLDEGGAVTLFRKDGILLVRYPPRAEVLGKQLPPDAPFYRVVQEGGGIARALGYVGRDSFSRVVSFHPIGDYPLVVTVAYAEESALADWRRRSIYIWLFALAATLGFALLFRALASQSRRLERQAAELAHSAAALTESEERLHRAQQVAQFGSSTRDLRTDKTVWSDECYRIFGVDRESFEPTTANMLALVHPEDRAALLAPRMASKSQPFQFRVIRPDGTIRYVHRVSELIRDGAGNPIIQIATVRDITADVLAERSLRDAKAAAEAANLAKSQFLANMSHELRTPLNAILGFSEMLMKEIAGALQPRQREYAEIIHGSGNHLLEIINDVLDLAKIDAGKIDLDEEVIEPMRVVRSCLEIVKENARAAGLAMSVESDGPVPALLCDARRLKQILLNLISNGIKFTEPGGSVTVGVRRAGDGGLVFVVCDTGQGMTLQEIEVALEPFGQLETGLNRQHHGTGLGLPLARSLAELHGGTLEVDSEKGHGTRVSVTFPASRVLSGMPEPAATATGAAA
jgi:PAS domain S-box-containing protein